MNKTNSIVERIKRFRSFEFKKNKIYLWNIPGILTPLSMNSYLWRLLEEKCGEEMAINILFSWGQEQGYHAYNLIAKKYGFEKSIRNKEKLIKFISEQSAFVGHGFFNSVKINFKDNIFIVRGVSFMAENYKEIFGLQKSPIDHFLRGQATAISSKIFNRKMFCVEGSCVANGKRECVFISKPLEKWNKKDTSFKDQFTKNTHPLKNHFL